MLATPQIPQKTLNPRGAPVTTADGAIKGPLGLAAQGEVFVFPAQLPTPFRVRAALSQVMQAFVGSERHIVGASVSAQLANSVAPLGFTVDQFNRLLEQTAIAIVIGDGSTSITKAIYSYAQMKDTKFIQRMLNIELHPDPTLWNSISFELRAPPPFFNFPPALGSAYTIQLNVMTYWSDPPWRPSQRSLPPGSLLIQKEPPLRRLTARSKVI